MKKYYLFLVLLFLFSCSEDKEVNPEGNTYKVVIEQSGDYTNYNKSLIAVTPDVNGQTLKFNNLEKNQIVDNLIDNAELSASKITLVSQTPSREIEFNFIISPIPTAPAIAGAMIIKFTFLKEEQVIAEKLFSFTDNFDVKEENLKFK
ncbi:MAG: beta-barrel fold lipoprotein [Adhaeribacter sp.]